MIPAAARLVGRLAFEEWIAILLAGVAGAATVAAGVGLLGTGAWLIATAALHPALAEIQVAVVGVRFFGISRAGFRYLERLAAHDATFRMLARLRVWFVAALEPLAPARLLERTSGDLVARAVSDVASLEPLVVRILGPVLAAVLVGAGTTGYLAWVADGAAWPFAVGFAAMAVCVPLLIGLRRRHRGPAAAEVRAEYSGATVDLVQGLADVLICAAADSQQHRVGRAADRLSRIRRRESDLDALAAMLAVVITHGTGVAILIAAIPAVRAGVLEPVMLGVLVLVAVAAFEATSGLPSAARELADQLRAAERLVEVVDCEPAVASVAIDAGCPPISSESVPEVHFDGVRFTYPGTDEPALAELDLRIAPGERLAVVGASGSGKSTLLALLTRTWDPSAGAVRVAGEDLRALPLEVYRQRLGVVTQRPHLFSGTVAENLRIVSPAASDEALVSACRAAQFEEVLAALPEGLNTQVGEHGRRLSGGQQQRLAVARAVLVDPAVLVLDEATSALDGPTASRMLESVDRVLAGRTQIHITHRLEAMERYDRIAVLDRGRLVQVGDHASLTARPGEYHSLWTIQNRSLASGG